MLLFCPSGNSLSAILDGEGRLMFLNRGEEYVMTMPYAHCKGTVGYFHLETGNLLCQRLSSQTQLIIKLLFIIIMKADIYTPFFQNLIILHLYYKHNTSNLKAIQIKI